MAITMRPQFASSPAIAVFTRGELAIDMAIRCAAASLCAPVTAISINFSAPSPSRATCWARSRQMPSSALAKFFSRASRADFNPGGAAPALPVANNKTVSDVDVSPSTVMQLKLEATLAESRPCKILAGMAASVKRNTSIVAMSGAIMPEPLAMPLMVTVFPAYVTEAVATLANVSVVMMARAASSQQSAVAPANRPGSAFTMGAGFSGSPITPVEA